MKAHISNDILEAAAQMAPGKRLLIPPMGSNHDGGWVLLVFKGQVAELIKATQGVRTRAVQFACSSSRRAPYPPQTSPAYRKIVRVIRSGGRVIPLEQ